MRPDLRAVNGGPSRTPDCEVVRELERAVLSGILIEPARISDARQILEPTDFSIPSHGSIYAALDRVPEISLQSLADELDRSGELERVGGLPAIAELADFEVSGALVAAHAKRVRRHALEREERRLAERAAQGDPDRRRMAEVAEKLDALEAGGLGIRQLGYTGARLEELRQRPQPVSPLPGFFDCEPGLIVASGRPKAGKTTFGACLALPWAKGERPWAGAPVLPGTGVLFLSAEQSAVRVDRLLRRLDHFTERPCLSKWSEQVTIVARDRDLPPTARRMLTLDEDGRALLRSTLMRDADAGQPFGLVILDSLSRLAPPDFDENDAGQVTAYLQGLQEVAEECRAWLLLVHHRGYTADPSRSDAVGAGRGSSAIAAVAPCAWVLDHVPSEPRQRVLKVAGNEILAAEHTFEVASEKSEPGAVLYFRLTDPLGSDAARINDLIGKDEALSQSALAWRVSGDMPSSPKDRPKGNAQQRAKALRERWEAADLIDVWHEGQAIMMRRKS